MGVTLRISSQLAYIAPGCRWSLLFLLSAPTHTPPALFLAALIIFQTDARGFDYKHGSRSRTLTRVDAMSETASAAESTLKLEYQSNFACQHEIFLKF